VIFKVAKIATIATRITENVSSSNQNMISGRGKSSVDAGRLTVHDGAVLTSSGNSFHVRHPETLKGPATDCGTLEGRDHQATGAC